MWYLTCYVLELLILFEVVFVTFSRYQNFCFFFLIFLLFHQFSYQENIFLMSSKTSNILKTNTCSKEHSYLFPDNLNACKVKKNNKLYRNLSIDLQSAIIDWFLCLFYLLFYLFLL